MTKRVIVTTGLKARGYVDGRYVGEEKPDNRRGEYANKKRRGKAVDGNRKRGKKRGAGGDDNFGNAVPGAKRGRRGRSRAEGTAAIEPGQRTEPGHGHGQGHGQGTGPRGNNPRRNRSGKKTPFRSPSQGAANPVSTAGSFSPSEVAQMLRTGNEARTGQFAEALAREATVKRERLHKVLAQSGIGSRRDMEIMISTGRVMVNGIVAGKGTSVAPDDKVLIDQRPVVLKFSQDLPRVLLYHKPEGEIVTTDDPGNRMTVFDNLPKVENGKWINIGRLDINTSGLLMFTTNGELANRFMHPRYEVEREYAVRLLGELTEEQEAKLLEGLLLDYSRRQGHGDEDEDDTDHHEVSGDDDTPIYPAKLERIERREGEEGEGANRWYHVVIKEGRNREVRRLFEAVGITVSRLIRTRFGDIALPPRLKRGMMYELTPDEVRRVLKTRGMDELADAPDESEGRRGRRRRGKPGHDERGPRPQRPDRGPRPPRPPRPPRNGQGQQAGAFTDSDGQPFDNVGNVVPGQEPRDPAKRRNRRRKRGRGKPEGEGQGDAQTTSAEGSSGAEASTSPPGIGNSAPRDPNQRRKRARRNFRKRNRHDGGSNEAGGGGTPPHTDDHENMGNE